MFSIYFFFKKFWIFNFNVVRFAPENETVKHKYYSSDRDYYQSTKLGWYTKYFKGSHPVGWLFLCLIF